jgi:hypothetical protein
MNSLVVATCHLNREAGFLGSKACRREGRPVPVSANYLNVYCVAEEGATLAGGNGLGNVELLRQLLEPGLTLDGHLLGKTLRLGLSYGSQVVQ